MRSVALATLALAGVAALGAADGVSGRVWLAADGGESPLPGVKVVLSERGKGRLLGVTRTDAQGRFAFAGPIDGPIRVQFSRNGYTPAAGDDYRNADCSGPCGPFEMELVRAAVLAGTVRDDLGEPVVDARVHLQCEGDEGPRASAPTDEQGRFRLAGLAPAAGCTVDVDVRRMGPRAAALDAEPVEVEIGAGETRELALGLRAAQTASLRVTGLVQGAGLTPAGDEGPGDGAYLFAYPVLRRGGGGGPGGSRRVRLGPDGAFKLEGLHPGAYVFRVQQGRRGRDDVYLGRHEIRTNVDGLTLTPQEPWLLAGRVEFDADPPEGRVLVTLVSTEGGGAVGFEARAPEFVIRSARPDLEAGDYRAEYRGSDWFIREVEAGGSAYPPDAVHLDAASAGSLVFRLSADMAAIRGRVKADAAGHAASHYRVALRGPRGVDSVQADQDGRFEFEKVPPGDYQIAAWEGETAQAVRGDAVWQRAGQAVRRFPVEAGAEIEIDLTAVASTEGR
ncbi:MAG: hypothetical protein GC160_21240 [Acidobacteria bacterium]|nr:hypothetical protein [Acidobacteriota bacterium]